MYNLLVPRSERRPLKVVTTLSIPTLTLPSIHPLYLPLKVVILRGREPIIYDPTAGEGGRTAGKSSVWNACDDYATAEALRCLGEAHRTVRPTVMNPSSSRGHTLFIVRFSKKVRAASDGVWG